MPMVEYFDPGTQSNKKIEFAYTTLGRQQARDFIKKKSGEAARGGYMMPRETKSIKDGRSRSPGPDDARHHPGVKIKDKRYPKVKKETKYVEGDPFEFDKKSTVKYSGYEY